MKKIIITVLTVAACLCLIAGCDKNQKPEETEAGSESKTETVTKAKETQSETESRQETVTGSETAPETQTKYEDTIDAECVVKKGHRYVIVLPKSGVSIPVENKYVKYLPYVSDELVAAAEAKITAEIGSLDDDPSWTVGEHGDKEICLVVEVIKFIDGVEEGGCGIDHEHLIFAEPIIEK